MRNNTWTAPFNFPPGTLVTGKWHGNGYSMIRKLGSGANGIVYLVRGKDGYSAMKMSSSPMSITSEVNVLKTFSEVQGALLGPSLIDVDDWCGYSAQPIPFYVMEYIHGPDLLTFTRSKGSSWIPLMIVQLLDILDRMHQRGWVFGDLKPENLLVTGQPAKIRCIDVGGTTREGRAIKEFTEFFDRGYWELGSRKAEPSYDIFSAALLMIHLYYPDKFQKNGQGVAQLQRMIEGRNELAPYKTILIKALKGRYLSAQQMKREILACSFERNDETGGRVARRRSKGTKKSSFRGTAAVLLTTAFLYGLYIYLFLI